MNTTIYKKHGRIYVRLRWTDPTTGKTREKNHHARTRTEAKELRSRLLVQYQQGGESLLDGQRMDFKTAAERYAAAKMIPAEYVQGRKVAGLRSLESAKSSLNAVIAHFSTQSLQSIKPSQLEEYKKLRLQTPTKHGHQRAIASVNRELEKMRAVCAWCVRQGWLQRSPFDCGEKLISKADETMRERILTDDEELRLLRACGSAHRAHLLPSADATVELRREKLQQIAEECDAIARQATRSWRSDFPARYSDAIALIDDLDTVAALSQ